jgi:hypothetical protein
MKNGLFALCILALPLLHGQVTIGSNNPPDPNAVLDLQSVQGGLLIPRLSTAQRNALNNPPRGLQIYNTDHDCMEMYFPSGWKSIMCDCSTAPAAPASLIGPTAACLGATALGFSVAPVPGATQYTWTINAQDTLVSGQGTNSIVVNFSNNAGNRTISVTAANFCGTSAATSTTILVNNPSAAFSSLPVSPIINQPATFTPATLGLASYAWTFSNGSPATSNSSSPQVTWTNLGTVSASLTVTDANGCSATQTNSLQVTNCQSFSQTFTPCGAVGLSGPSQSQANTTYGPGVVTVTNGIQFYTIPSSGTYQIEVAGADGSHNGSGYGGGGRGAVLRARFSLNQGDVLKILVGQRGKHGTSAGGGGGGTFVTTSANVPLIVAGGGGSTRSGATLNLSILDAVTTTCGRTGTGGAGGCNGNGAPYSSEYGPGGAGLSTDGPAHADTRSMCNKSVARSFVNGGTGGELLYSCGSTTNLVQGGFGGGAAAGWGGAGGGGGYSGGGAGTNASDAGYGGGGGSFVASSASQVATSNGQYESSGSFGGNPIVNLNQWNQNNGYVTITRICP